MIRTATKEDIPEIVELMKSEPGFWPDNPPKDVLERAIDSVDCLAFLWEENEQVIAFASAHDVGFLAYLSTLIVAGPARNKGIGKKLIQHIENELTARGCNTLISDVWKNAVGFYKSLGWSEPDEVLLRKKLIWD
jgi:N-acetylglutamate synthase-like GNAT family acetyltransferase